jgi:hypothetical protein
LGISIGYADVCSAAQACRRHAGMHSQQLIWYNATILEF